LFRLLIPEIIYYVINKDWELLFIVLTTCINPFAITKNLHYLLCFSIACCIKLTWFYRLSANIKIQIIYKIRMIRHRSCSFDSFTNDDPVLYHYLLYSRRRENAFGRRPKFVRSRAFPPLNLPERWPPSILAAATVAATVAAAVTAAALETVSVFVYSVYYNSVTIILRVYVHTYNFHFCAHTVFSCLIT